MEFADGIIFILNQIMNELFPTEDLLPPGFNYYPAFLSKEEEQKLYKEILKIEIKPMIFQGYEAKRKVASFGYDWSFTHRRLSPGKEIPKEFNFLLEKVAQKIDISSNKFAEFLITEYPVGSVINWHRDAPPFDLIAGISLLTKCNFRLRPYDKDKRNRKSIRSLEVEPRSLYTMSGPAREEWEHSTSPVEAVRYSITLRTLK